MGCQSRVLHCYEQISMTVESMLIPARSGQWGELPALEAKYSDMVDRLKTIEAQETLNEDQNKLKMCFLSGITKNHEEVTRLVKPQLDELSALIRSMSQQSNLAQAYGRGTSAMA